MRRVEQILADAVPLLEERLGLGRSAARIEAQMLLQHVLKVQRAWLMAHSEFLPSQEQSAGFQALLHQRLHGVPIAYLLGEREFHGLLFKVTPATLIPRPDTELLVDQALARLPPPFDASFRLLDMGAGSGAVSLSIAHERPDVDVTAVDVSAAALEVAQENALLLNIKNVGFLPSNWFSALYGERFDLIVSNPPYIADADVHLQQGDLRFEPRAALASGKDGLDDIRCIVAEAPSHLNPGGWLLLEHGYNQAGQVRELMEQAGFKQVYSVRDLAGIERVSGGCFST